MMMMIHKMPKPAASIHASQMGFRYDVGTITHWGARQTACTGGDSRYVVDVMKRDCRPPRSPGERFG
jgi:hypothetical protein